MCCLFAIVVFALFAVAPAVNVYLLIQNTDDICLWILITLYSLTVVFGTIWTVAASRGPTDETFRVTSLVLLIAQSLIMAAKWSQMYFELEEYENYIYLAYSLSIIIHFVALMLLKVQPADKTVPPITRKSKKEIPMKKKNPKPLEEPLINI